MPAEARDVPALADQNVVNPGGVSGLNYTPHYIVGFGITGENGMSGGGPNIWRAEGDGPAGGGKETCCIGIPEIWKPDMKVTIRWEVEKVPDGKTPGIHYMAEARIPRYARATYGFWVIFLPGDRVKAMVMDGNSTGQNSVWKRPNDDDPYVAQGWSMKRRTERRRSAAASIPCCRQTAQKGERNERTALAEEDAEVRWTG
ncbi:MAG: DUF3304 domain-containing protein [Cupriavidus necator]